MSHQSQTYPHAILEFSELSNLVLKTTNCFVKLFKKGLFDNKHLKFRTIMVKKKWPVVFKMALFINLTNKQ